MDILKAEQCRETPSGYEVVINGGRKPMGIDALTWALRGEQLGAGELVINSIDADGTKQGYEINLTRMIAEAVSIPVIASSRIFKKHFGISTQYQMGNNNRDSGNHIADIYD